MGHPKPVHRLPPDCRRLFTQSGSVPRQVTGKAHDAGSGRGLRCKTLSHKSLLQFYGVAGLLRHPDRGGMMLIGYARVSTQDQTLRLQHDALTDGGCEKLFREKLGEL